MISKELKEKLDKLSEKDILIYMDTVKDEETRKDISKYIDERFYADQIAMTKQANIENFSKPDILAGNEDNIPGEVL